MSEPLKEEEEEDACGEPAAAEGEAVGMDIFTSLLFEDMEEDGITGGAVDTPEEEEENTAGLEAEKQINAREGVIPGELRHNGVCATDWRMVAGQVERDALIISHSAIFQVLSHTHAIHVPLVHLAPTFAKSVCFNQRC